MKKHFLMGKRFRFSADDFQMPFDPPENRNPNVSGWQYRGEVVKVSKKYVGVKLLSPKFAVGKLIRMTKEQLLEESGHMLVIGQGRMCWK